MSARPHPSLRELQLTIWKLLAAPEGVRPGLAALTRAGEMKGDELTEWIAGDDRLDAVGRVDVYAHMYFFRLHDVLREEFEKTLAVLGDARFHNLVTDYLLVHPSAHPNLRWLGGPLPAFLSAHAYGREFPHAADLAALEWGRNAAFQAFDAEPLERAALGSVPPERFGDLVFSVAPSVSLVDVRHEVGPLYDRLDGGEEADETAERAHTLLVYRSGFAPVHEEVPPDEARALRAAAAGKTFADVCDAITAPLAEPDATAPTDEELAAAAERAAALLAGWLDREILTGHALADERPE